MQKASAAEIIEDTSTVMTTGRNFNAATVLFVLLLIYFYVYFHLLFSLKNLLDILSFFFEVFSFMVVA